ncbi:MAG: hypothetical protein KF678_02335 [Phycisphaeraceae bacterium]|nr:hypothetical protein [Phycisphaeraceae bacterium]
MQPLDLVRLIADLCSRMKLAYFVTGSFASSYFGRYRTTEDIDVVIELPSWQVREFCEAFPQPDWYVSPEAAMDAARGPGTFNVIHAPSALKIDVIVFDGSPFNESRLARARTVQLPGGGTAQFSSPEDVILSKLVFFRMGGSEKHPTDIAGIFQISGQELDLVYIEHWSLMLGVKDQWTLIKRRLGLP